MKLEEPKARESLLTPSMRSALSSPAPGHPGTPKTPTAPKAAADTPPQLSSQDSQTYSPMKQVEVANAALLERTAFAIDDAKDEDEGSDADSGGGADDDEVMDEVCVVNFDHVSSEFTLVCSG